MIGDMGQSFFGVATHNRGIRSGYKRIPVRIRRAKKLTHRLCIPSSGMLLQEEKNPQTTPPARAQYRHGISAGAHPAMTVILPASLERSRIDSFCAET